MSSDELNDVQAASEPVRKRTRRGGDPDVKRQRLNPLDGDVDGIAIAFDGSESYMVRFAYNPELIAQMRKIPGAEFKDDGWRVPVAQYDALAAAASAMRKEYLIDTVSHDGIASLADAAARVRQEDSSLAPRLTDFHASGETSRGEIISRNDRYAAQLTGLGRQDGVAFVTLHRLSDLSEQVLKGDRVSITYGDKGRGVVGQLQTLEEKLDGSLARTVDGVCVWEDAGQYKIAFDYNPNLSDRIGRIQGAHFDREESVWIADAGLKTFVARAVNDMRKEVVADKSDRDQIIAMAGERIDAPKTHDAFVSDGKVYVGQVLASNERYVLQHTGKDHVALHRARNLDDLPAIGANVRIQYQRGRGQVVDRALERSQSQAVAR